MGDTLKDREQKASAIVSSQRRNSKARMALERTTKLVGDASYGPLA